MSHFQEKENEQWNQPQIATGTSQFNFSNLDPSANVNDQQMTENPTIDLQPIEIEQTSSAPLTGVYSSSGFDMIGVLSRLVNRPNPQINLGPIDMSCSFLVTDARQYDCPIVYCSPTFEHLTGYVATEIMGRNCRFLQAPDGQVTCGSRRTYTDNQAVYHLKAQMLQNKEHQASIINYRKGGQPFVNLVTVIPISCDDNKGSFFVGLQVDLVEQPNAILEKMKNGTYMVNYQQMNVPPYIPGGHFSSEPVDDYFRELPSTAPSSTTLASPDILELVNCSGENEQQLQQEWNKLLLDQTEDFIHVLSLKGFFLYCSRSSSHILEHDPEELVGHPLSSICHPSDIVPVMREIKESAGNPDRVVSFIYRVRRKYSGYMWMECQGKIHIDLSKGRKCLILAGRERPMYELIRKEIVHSSINNNNNDIANIGSEFWAKSTLTGLLLHVTPTSEEVIGFDSDTLQGATLYQYVGDDHVRDITRALELVKEGRIVNLHHTMQNHKGDYVSIFSTFYPGDISFGVGRPSFVLIQMRAKESNTNNTPALESIMKEVPTIDINNNNNNNENIFAELETVRGTSWQYELHQLQLTNRKLKEQLESYTNPKRKKQKKKKASSESPDIPKMCAQCQSTDSPEWRKGPNGPKELCNACGLRYAKSLAAKKNNHGKNNNKS
ncbi:putative blue-light photoreceptor PCMADA1 [Cokeromyces recurvatus]|uniref:putative blue-light photoreceptor PCMADA1 n=1 Tax=Cokeromyces recurvatus TaxID=90255 RepID=UPI00221FB159|nr:putative blue-light photoreceptor PCMADA1 [Cokeromyces recurvatus]KAI7901490.1 putative blue-light photoreceptor PCMADA1 [Cokeromyces recurvatus]